MISLLIALVVALEGPWAQRSIDNFFSDFTAEWMRGNPDGATSTRYFAGEEQDRLDRQLTPQTDSYRHGRIKLAEKGLNELRKFDRSSMSELQRISAELMQWQLDIIVKGEPYLDYSFPLNQFNGINVIIVETMTLRHPLAKERDAVNYVAALGQVSTRMNETIAEGERLAAKNMLPPRFIVEATKAQMKHFIAVAPSQNPLVATFDQRMAAVTAIPEQRRAELRSEAEKIVSSQVYASWQKAIELLESLVPRTSDEAGLWRLPHGLDAYAYSLRRFTSTDLSPDEIYDAGTREVARIEKEMDRILRQLGRTEGTVKERIDSLKADLAYPQTEEGRKLIMSDVEQILRDAERRAQSLFDERPKAPVVAQPFPRFREANAAANYSTPAPDGSRPGIIQIPLRAERMTKFGLRTLVYHEGVPGHHFQLALEMENKSLPRFRQIRALGVLPGTSEGWALYAERLAVESGWYGEDLEGRLGQLDNELFRARRLVVDTGIHAKHWTRQQAIDYGIEPSEVERYVVYPGQACSYMVGELQIIAMKEKAQKTLGAQFSLNQFHNAILNTGSVPLGLLERRVDLYIRAAAKGGTQP